MLKYYNDVTRCRSCGGEKFRELQTSPNMPIAGIYYDKAPVNVNAPIHLIQCETCGLVQLREAIRPSIYEDYSFIGNSSLGYKSHLQSVAQMLIDRYGLKNKRIYEIGASNGVLLELLSEMGDNDVTGVEPSSKLCNDASERGITIHNAFFCEQYARDSRLPKQDCVVIRHVLEHIEELNDVIRGVSHILKPDGVLLIEVPDFAQTVQNRIYSNIFHEHQNYFTRETMNTLLSSHGFHSEESLDADIHGGAFLTVYRHGEAVTQTAFSAGIEPSAVTRFVKDSVHYYSRLSRMIHSYTEHFKIVHGYGGSHRTFILMGNAELSGDDVPFIYDGNPFLHGRKLNGFHSEVISPERLHHHQPDAIVVFATSYHNEIVRDLREKYDYQGEILSAQAEDLIDQ